MRYGNFDGLRTQLRTWQTRAAASRVSAPLRGPAVPAAELPEGKGLRVQLGEEVVAVFRCNGTTYAVQDRCPHAGASLAEGVVDEMELICPAHGYRFCLRTGRGITDPTLRLKVYPVRREQDAFVVESPPE